MRNLIQKLRKLSRKGLVPWSLMRLSAVWYDVGYDIQSFNMAVCFEILIFFGRSTSYEVVFLYSSQKLHNNHVFFLVLIIPYWNLRHKQPLKSHIEPPLKSCRFVAKHQIFLNFSDNSLKKNHIVVLLCLNVQTIKSQFEGSGLL